MSSKTAKKHKKIPFTAEEDEQLIEHISSFEYMWNMQHADFKSGHKKDIVWQEIMDKLRRNRDECQARWKSIRDHYKRQRKEDIGRTGSGAKKKRASYWDSLSFLDKTEDERDTFSIISAVTPESIDHCYYAKQDSMNDISPSRNVFETSSYESDETLEPPIIRPTRQIRKTENSELVKYFNEKKDQNTQLNYSIKELLKCDEDDDIDLFFKSIAFTVKKFKPQLVSKTKIKVLEIVSDMEQLQNTEVGQIQLINYPSFLTTAYNSNTHPTSPIGYTEELSNHSSHHNKSSLTSPVPYKAELSCVSSDVTD